MNRFMKALDILRQAGDTTRRHRLAESGVFCMAPWTQLHVLPTGEVFTCCMAAEPRDAIGNLRQGDTLETAWNSPAMRALRSNMLAERPSPSCHLCYKGEAVGQGSLRTAENLRMASHYDAVEATATDGNLERFAVPTLDIRFSNVCNLRCRICSAKLSSAWHADAVKLGVVAPAQPAVLTASEDPAVLLEQVLALLPGVERMHFAGGEPLMSEEHYVILERFPNERKREVQLTYNTNLSKLRFRHWDAVAFWREFPRVYMQASLDGMGARGEYMRKGQRWDEAVANRRRILAECPHIDFVVHATVSALNALHLPDFYRAWLEEGLIGPGGMQLNILHGPPYYNIRALPPGLKDRVEGSYRALIAFLDSIGEAAASPRRDFEAVIRYMRADDWDLTEEFRERSAELDVVRGESLAATFPELAEWIDASSPSGRLRTVRVSERLGMSNDTSAELDRLIADLNGLEEAAPRVLWEALALRGRLRRASGDPAGAEEDFVLAARLRPGGAEPSRLSEGPAMTDTSDAVRDAGELYVLSMRQRRAGDMAGALTSLGQAVERAPAEAIALLTRRLREIEEGQPVLIQEDRPELPDVLDNPAVVHYLRGLARQAADDVEGARADFDRVTALEPLLRAAADARQALGDRPA